MMTAQDVVDLYRCVEESGIVMWLDGGWGVDALLARQLRPHSDLDIAIDWKDVPRLRSTLEQRRFREVRQESQYNFVLGDEDGHELDVHAFVRDERGAIVDGVQYPARALCGTGIIAGHEVRCIAPREMIEFLAPWISKWPDKYVPAVAALAEAFGLELPREYLEYVDIASLAAGPHSGPRRA